MIAVIKVIIEKSHSIANSSLFPTFTYLHSNSTQILALKKPGFFTFSGSKKNFKFFFENTLASARWKPHVSCSFVVENALMKNRVSGGLPVHIQYRILKEWWFFIVFVRDVFIFITINEFITCFSRIRNLRIFSRNSMFLKDQYGEQFEVTFWMKKKLKDRSWYHVTFS